MKLINTDKAEGTKVAGKYLDMFPFTGTVAKLPDWLKKSAELLRPNK